jgi:multiple sugar transport system permease protein
VYVLFAKLHLVGSLWPLILPNFLGDAFSIFLLRQFFLTIPEEYADAARVDGCGELRILFTVFVGSRSRDRCRRPLRVPLLLQRLLRSAPVHERELDNWTLSLGLSQFRTIYQVEWNLTMAATLIFMAPVILLFFLAQRAFVEGVTLTGVKG